MVTCQHHKVTKKCKRIEGLTLCKLAAVRHVRAFIESGVTLIQN